MTIKQKIWAKLDEDGYITDSELYKIYGKEPNFTTAEEYKRQYYQFQKDKQFFADKKIIEKSHFNNKYFLRTSELTEGQFWAKVGKDFYDLASIDLINKLKELALCIKFLAPNNLAILSHN